MHHMTRNETTKRRDGRDTTHNTHTHTPRGSGRSSDQRKVPTAKCRRPFPTNGPPVKIHPSIASEEKDRETPAEARLRPKTHLFGPHRAHTGSSSFFFFSSPAGRKRTRACSSGSCWRRRRRRSKVCRFSLGLYLCSYTHNHHPSRTYTYMTYAHAFNV